MSSNQKAPPSADSPITAPPAVTPRTPAANASAGRPRWLSFVIGLQCLALAVLLVVLAAASGLFSTGQDEVDESDLSSGGPRTTAAESSAQHEPHLPVSAATGNAEVESQRDDPLSVEAGKKVTPEKKADEAVPPPKEVKPSGPALSPQSPPSAKQLPPKKTPLKLLPNAVHIPATLSSRSEMILGQLSLPTGAAMDIELHGGDTAYQVTLRHSDTQKSDATRTSQLDAGVNSNAGRELEYEGVATFVLKQTFDDAGTIFWNIDLTDYRGTIATIWVADDKLRFKWTENSRRYEAAAYLCNCVLEITVPEWASAAAIALRKPVQADPAPIDFVRGSATTEYPIPFMPPDVTLTVEVVGATKHLPQPSFGSDRWLNTARDSMQLKFGDGAPLLVKVIASTHYTGKQPRIITANEFSLSRVADNVTGRLSQLARLRQQTERSLQLAKDRKAELAKLKPSNAAQRSELSKVLRSLDLETRDLRSQLQRIAWLDRITKLSQDSPGIVFRIIHSAGDYTVDLVHGG